MGTRYPTCLPLSSVLCTLYSLLLSHRVTYPTPCDNVTSDKTAISTVARKRATLVRRLLCSKEYREIRETKEFREFRDRLARIVFRSAFLKLPHSLKTQQSAQKQTAEQIRHCLIIPRSCHTQVT